MCYVVLKLGVFCVHVRNLCTQNSRIVEQGETREIREERASDLSGNDPKTCLHRVQLGTSICFSERDGSLDTT